MLSAFFLSPSLFVSLSRFHVSKRQEGYKERCQAFQHAVSKSLSKPNKEASVFCFLQARRGEERRLCLKNKDLPGVFVWKGGEKDFILFFVNIGGAVKVKKKTQFESDNSGDLLCLCML